MNRNVCYNKDFTWALVSAIISVVSVNAVKLPCCISIWLAE